MPPLKWICSKHWTWKCSLCNQNQHQQQALAQSTTAAAVESPPQGSSDIPEASSPLSLISAYGTQENAESITRITSPPASTSSQKEEVKEDQSSAPLVDSFTSANSSLPVSSTSTSSDKQGVQKTEKRKASEDKNEKILSTNFSQLSKRIKVSKPVISCEVALKVLRGLNWFDHGFLYSGKVLAWALQPDDPDFARIHEYVSISQHPEMPVKILSILRIITAADKLETDVPLDFNHHPNAAEMYRKMLWHGTWTWNVSSILETGHRPRYYFSNEGIYFADRVAQSVHYCDNNRNDGCSSVGYLFLSDVLLGKKGDWNESDIRHLSTNVGDIECDFRRIEGQTIPLKEMNVEVDGCIWPLGSSAGNMQAKPGMWRHYVSPYNEYIVYNSAQVQPKYLIKVQIGPRQFY